MPNRIAALVQFLKNDPTVGTNGMTKGRIFPHELPDGQVGRMPRACLVIRSAGGAQTIGARTRGDYSDGRVDIRHYAWSPDSANDLYEAVQAALKALDRVVVGDTVLHWCNPAGGPQDMRDAPVPWPGGPVDNSVHWPFVSASWQVMAADVSVPVPA